MELINVNQDEAVNAEVVETSANNFLVANTSPITYNELKQKCIIPSFARDNESTLSHIEFIDLVGEVCKQFFVGEKVLSPAIRVSHPISGRIPEAMGKPVERLQEYEKTLYFSRMAFIYEIPSIESDLHGNKLSLSVGGVRSYNLENLYGRKSEERFKLFVGFKNQICTNMCIQSDGFISDLRVMSIQELFNHAFKLVTRFDREFQLQMLSNLSDYSLTEKEFALLIGRSRLYNYLPLKQKKEVEKLPLSDTQISMIAKDYYQDKSFCRSEDGNIDCWKVYNLFTSACKSSYIDTWLDRSAGSFIFISELINHL